MIKRLATIVLCLAITTQIAWCDWDHHFYHGGHDSDLSSDPNFVAFVWTMVLAIVASAVLLFLAGPFLIIFTRRTRDILWIVPLANLLLYLLSISLRSYPGGFAARFRPPGLIYTLVEIVLLLVMSFIIALILAAIQWLVRKARSRSKKDATIT